MLHKYEMSHHSHRAQCASWCHQRGETPRLWQRHGGKFCGFCWQWEAWVDARVAVDNPSQEVLCCALGCHPHPAAAPCTMQGVEGSPTPCGVGMAPSGLRAGLGFLQGPYEVPQLGLRGCLISIGRIPIGRILLQNVLEGPSWDQTYPWEKASVKNPPPLLHESVSGTPISQREAKLNASSLCLLPWHSSWCQRLILIGLFPCQMEAADSHPRCAWLVWRPDYLVSVSSWPLIKGTLTYITFQLFTLQGGGGAPFKQFPARKPTFVIFFGGVKKSRLPSVAGRSGMTKSLS